MDGDETTGALDPPSVSVVFLAHDRRDELRVALGTMLHETDFPAELLEVIVVDNASTDGTVEMLRADFPGVEVVANARNVGASGWNAGFERAAGDYVLVLDDDCYIPGAGLRVAALTARREEADLVSFTVVSSFDENHRFNDTYPTGLLSYWGCAALLSRRALRELGGYDRNIFIWANELELTMRLLDGGFRHLFLPEVTAVHMKRPADGTGVWLPYPYRMNARHYAYVAGKLMRPVDALRTLGNLLAHSCLDAWADDRRALRAFPDVLAGFANGLRHRRPVRPAVSRAYRENFRPFSGPWFFLRSPRERWRARRSSEARDLEGRRRGDAYYGERPRFYPAGRASLDL